MGKKTTETSPDIQAELDALTGDQPADNAGQPADNTADTSQEGATQPEGAPDAPPPPADQAPDTNPEPDVGPGTNDQPEPETEPEPEEIKVDQADGVVRDSCQADVDLKHQAKREEEYLRAWNRDHPENQRGPVEWWAYPPAESDTSDEPPAE